MVLVKGSSEYFLNFAIIDLHDLLEGLEPVNHPPHHSVHPERFHQGQQLQVLEDNRQVRDGDILQRYGRSGSYREGENLERNMDTTVSPYYKTTQQ